MSKYVSSLRTGERVKLADLPPVGTPVRALRVIDDATERGRRYVHARKGDVGIIAGYNGQDDVPTINWPTGGSYDCIVGIDVEVVG